MGKFLVGLGGGVFLQRAASHLFNERKMFCCKMPYSSAAIPSAGAPSGFDGTPQAFALK